MTNPTALDALKEIKTYCAPELLDALDYVISIVEKLEADGVSRPLEADFSKVKN